MVSVEFREQQVSLLETFLYPNISILEPSVIIEGPSSSGKTFTLSKYLLSNQQHFLHIDIDCRSCVSKKVLLQRILRQLSRSLQIDHPSLHNLISQCDNLSFFMESLRQILLHKKNKSDNEEEHIPTVIILDNIDQIPGDDHPSELCSALSKLHEQSPSFNIFSFVFVVRRSDILDLSTSGIPVITFDSYTPTQIRHILLNNIVDKEWLEVMMKGVKITEQQLRSFVKQFIKMIYDTYSSYFGSDINLIVPVLDKLWPVFYKPLSDYGKFEQGENDVLTTFMKVKPYLQSQPNLLSQSENSLNIIELLKSQQLQQQTPENDLLDSGVYTLSRKTKYLIAAAYIASVNDPNLDMHYFTKQKDARVKNRYRQNNRKKTASPSKSNDTLSASSLLNTRFYYPHAFTLERLLAILASITDIHDGVMITSDVELMSELSTLTSLKALARANKHDILSGEAKWRCGVRWSVVKTFSDELGFEIENYIQQDDVR